MRRILFLVDGFNLYHALMAAPRYHRYRWVNVARLAQCYVTKKDQTVEVLYFIAYHMGA